MNKHLRLFGHVGETEARDFSTLLKNIEDKVQSFESNTEYLLSWVATTIQMVSST